MLCKKEFEQNELRIGYNSNNLYVTTLSVVDDNQQLSQQTCFCACALIDVLHYTSSRNNYMFREVECDHGC